MNAPGLRRAVFFLGFTMAVGCGEAEAPKVAKATASVAPMGPPRAAAACATRRQNSRTITAGETRRRAARCGARRPSSRRADPGATGGGRGTGLGCRSRRRACVAHRCRSTSRRGAGGRNDERNRSRSTTTSGRDTASQEEICVLGGQRRTQASLGHGRSREFLQVPRGHAEVPRRPPTPAGERSRIHAGDHPEIRGQTAQASRRARVLLRSGTGQATFRSTQPGAASPPVATKSPPVASTRVTLEAEPLHEGDNTQRAKAGVGKKGRNYGGGIITEPIKQRFQVEDRLNFMKMEKGIADFKILNERFPKNQQEFMSEIIEKNAVRLPELPPGDEYVYDAKSGRTVGAAYQGGQVTS